MCLRHDLNTSASPIPYLLPFAESKTGTPEGTRTPDLLLRSVGNGLFTDILSPFGTLLWGDLNINFSLTVLFPYQFFRFWVRIWVRQFCRLVGLANGLEPKAGVYYEPYVTLETGEKQLRIAAKSLYAIDKETEPSNTRMIPFHWLKKTTSCAGGSKKL